jgi:hypothetical protein
MTKAAEPMTGGISWPPVDAVASTAPACSGLRPVRFISGMVTMPVPTTFDTALPEMVPNSAEAPTAALALPPRKRPKPESARRVMYSPPPVWRSSSPKNTKGMTISSATRSGRPSNPLGSSSR